MRYAYVYGALVMNTVTRRRGVIVGKTHDGFYVSVKGEEMRLWWARELVQPAAKNIVTGVRNMTLLLRAVDSANNSQGMREEEWEALPFALRNKAYSRGLVVKRGPPQRQGQYTYQITRKGRSVIV